MLGAQHREKALLRAMLQLGALLPKETGCRLQVLEIGVLLDRVTAQGPASKAKSCSEEAKALLERFDEICEHKDHRWKDCIL
eukprot:g31539.t1